MSIQETLPLVRRLYAGDDRCTRNTGKVGGHLHTVFQDQNVEDENVNGCLSQAREEECDPCAQIAEQLQLMSRSQRTRLAHRVRTQ